MLIEYSTLITVLILWVSSIYFSYKRAYTIGVLSGVSIGTSVTINMLVEKGYINTDKVKEDNVFLNNNQ